MGPIVSVDYVTDVMKDRNGRKQVAEEVEEYLIALVRSFKGKTVGNKISILKDHVLYWRNSSLFWNEAYDELREKPL